MPWGKINISGGARLNYTVVSAASVAALPSAPSENTVCLITSVSIGEVYPTNEALTGLQNGDVILRQFAPSNTRINALKKGRLDLYLSGAYQMQSSVLVPVESYLYQDSAWKRIYILFYKNSTYLPIVGGYARAGAATLTQESDNLKLSMANQGGFVYSVNQIDLTNINTIWFYGGSSANVIAYLNVSKSTTDNTYGAQVVLPKQGNAWVSLDVSALTGSYYLRFGRGDVALTTILRCYEWFGLQ